MSLLDRQRCNAWHYRTDIFLCAHHVVLLIGYSFECDDALERHFVFCYSVVIRICVQNALEGLVFVVGEDAEAPELTDQS
jgi:hypothetical protein